MKGVFIFLIFLACKINAQQILPCDKNATKETVALYKNLFRVKEKGFMFGHQDDLAYGVNWKYQDGRSDIKDVCGDYPAVYGWELGNIEFDSTKNLDGVPYKKMQQFIKDGYKRGSVITISWHLHNPLTLKSAWEPADGTVTSILPGGSKNELFKKWLTKVAAFMNTLKDKKGNMIPVIFRPFHELNGSWFWWGKKYCTPNELKQLYQFTVDYLKNKKHLHNLLYAFNTDKFYSKEEYLERYPGNEYVDVLGFDIYQRGNDNKAFIADFDKMLTLIESIAKENKKLPAVTEFGYAQVPDSTWWTNVLLLALSNHKVSYALAWRNAGKKSETETEFYVPYKGQASENNFKKFYTDKKTFFEKNISNEKLYE